MVRVEKVDARVTVLIFDEARTCWLVRDRKTILIETGHPAEFPLLLAGLGQLSMRLEDIDFLALTHIHIDHAGGTGHLSGAHPSLRIFVHEAGVRHLLDPFRLMESVKGAYGGRFPAVGEMLAVPSPVMIVPVGTGDIIDLGGAVLEVYETPGHAKHHVVYFDRASGSVFSGDALGSLYPGHPNFVLAPPADYDRDAAKKSADLIRGLNPKWINFTHCGPYALAEDDGFFERLKGKHDLWNECLIEITKERPRADYEWIFGQFLKRVPEVGEYPDQMFSFDLSVRGILTHLRKSGKIEYNGF